MVRARVGVVCIVNRLQSTRQIADNKYKSVAVLRLGEMRLYSMCAPPGCGVQLLRQER